MALKTLYPLNGGSNQDLSELSVNSRGGEVVERRNGRINSSKKNRIGINTPLKGMLSVSNLELPATGTNKVIHYIEDIERSAGIFFLYNSNYNHCIFSIDIVSEVITPIIINEPLLNFDLDYPISSNIIGDLLYWTDGLNEPRKINQNIEQQSGDITGFSQLSNSIDSFSAYITKSITGFSVISGSITSYSALLGSITAFTSVLTGNVDNVTNDGGDALFSSINHGLSTNDQIKITGTTSYNGIYNVTVITSNTFKVNLLFVDFESGFWSITKTTVSSTNHGLLNGDEIAITGTTNYNGSYFISNITTNTFQINRAFVSDDATGTWTSNERTIVTSASHNLLNGDEITISGTTNYNGTSTISNVTANTFDINTEFIVDDATGTWVEDATKTIVTSASHGFINGNQITISNTGNYNGTYTISNVTVNTFKIVFVFNGTETGDIILDNITLVASNDHGLIVGDEITITGTTNYDGIYIISEFTTNTFNITTSFIDNDSGTLVLNDFIIVTSSNHGLLNGDIIKIVNTVYDNTYTIFNVLTNSFRIEVAYISDDVGIWSIQIDEQQLNSAIIPPYKHPEVYNTSKGSTSLVGYWDDATYKNNNLRGKQFQFCYRWIYDDNEKSLFSPFSVIPIPHEEEAVGGFFVDDITTNNTISVGIRTGSKYVKKIELAVKAGDGVWQSYDTLVKEELSINDNDIKIYQFRNEKVPFPLDEKEVFQSNNFIPQLAGSQEFLPTKQLLYADITEGYPNNDINVSLAINESNTPDWTQAITPMDIEEITTIITETITHINNVIKLPLTAQTNKLHVVSIILENGERLSVDSSGFDWGSGTYPSNLKTYLVAELKKIKIDQPPIMKTSWDLTFGDDDEIWFLMRDSKYINFSRIDAFYYSPVVVDTIRRRRTLAHGEYELGIVYSDKYGRKGAVQKSNDTRVFIDEDDLSNANSVVNLDWQLKHLPPIWAYSYQLVLSRNLSDQNVFQWMVTDATPIVINGIDHVQLTVNPAILNNKSINNKISYEPYIFKEGDYIRQRGILAGRFMYGSSDDNRYEIVQVDSSQVKKKKQYQYDETNQEWKSTEVDIVDENGNNINNDFFSKITIRGDGSLWTGVSSDPIIVVFIKVLIEIVTPQKELPDTIFHEIGESYEVGAPTTEFRYHKGQTQDQNNSNPTTTPAKGTITNGDYVFKVRYDLAKGIDFQCIDKNQSDYYVSREDGFGRIFVEDKDSDTKRYNKLRYSGKYFDDTNINYLSSFDGDNYLSIDDKYGRITDVIQIGDVLKIIQKNKTTSLYIGKSFLQTSSTEQGSQLSAIERTFGTLLPSIDSYGSSRKLSVSKHNRHLYYFDEDRGELIRSSPNGEFPISSYGRRSYFTRKKAELTAARKNGQQNEVLTWFDIEHNELLVTFTINGVTETVSFLEGDNLWINDYDWQLPDLYGNIGDVLFSFKSGVLYLHERTENYNEFYGVTKPFSLSFISNELPDNDKNFLAISLDSTTAFKVDITTPITATRPVGQHTYIKELGFREKQGNIEATFPKNIRRLDNGEDLESLLFTGNKMAGKFAIITLTKDTPIDFKLYRAEIEYLQML